VRRNYRRRNNIIVIERVGCWRWFGCCHYFFIFILIVVGRVFALVAAVINIAVANASSSCGRR
jgi:hypothetical protein